MPGLIISARNATEAVIAHRGGAEIIDLKEPQHGALGQPDLPVVRQALRALPPDTVCSLACGELTQRLPFPDGAEASAIRFAKAGPAGLASLSSWQAHFASFRQLLPWRVEPVAVAYADHEIAGSAPPAELLVAAERMGARALLLDTFSKEHGTVFECLAGTTLEAMFEQARRLGIWMALAGSLTHKDLRRAVNLGPRYLAMRGGVCVGGRESALCLQMIRRVSAGLNVEKAHRLQVEARPTA